MYYAYVCVCYVNVYFVCVNLLLLTVWKSDSWVTIHAISLDSVWSSMHQPLSLGWFLGTSTETETNWLYQPKRRLTLWSSLLTLGSFLFPSQPCLPWRVQHFCPGLRTPRLPTLIAWSADNLPCPAPERDSNEKHIAYYLHYLQYTLIEREREKERKKERKKERTCINMH